MRQKYIFGTGSPKQEPRNRLCSTSSLFFGFQGIFLGREASHFPSSSAECDNECSYITTHHKRFHGACRNNSTFYFYQNLHATVIGKLTKLDTFSALIAPPPLYIALIASLPLDLSSASLTIMFE
jgi:hypothetical protein